MPQHGESKNQNDTANPSACPKTAHSDKNPNENPRFSAIYTFDSTLLKDMIKAHSSTSAQHVDSISKLFKQFGVELVSVGIPTFDPHSKQIESELTICATDFKTLGAAMVKLSELGLPFKKRIGNWFSGGQLSGSPQNDSKQAVKNDSMAQSPVSNWDRETKGNPQEVIYSMGGLHRETPLKSSSSGMGKSFMDDENDVFSGNRLRSYSDRIPSGETSSSMGSGNCARTVLSLPETRTKSLQTEQDVRVAPPSPSKSLRTPSFSMKQPFPSLAERPEDHLLTETSVSAGTLGSHEGWAKIDGQHPNRKETPEPVKDIYQVPQRRLSDARDLPKLKIDTSVAMYGGRYSTEAEVPLAPFSAIIPDGNCYGAYVDAMGSNAATQANDPFALDILRNDLTLWDLHTGEFGTSSKFTIPVSASGGTSFFGGFPRDRSNPYQSSNSEESRMVPQYPSKAPNTGYSNRPRSPIGQHSGNLYLTATSELTGQCYRFTEAAKQHNVRVQAPPRMGQENNLHPMQQQQQQQQQQPVLSSGGYYAGYQSGFASRPPPMQFRQEIFPQFAPDIYMGAGSSDGYSSYVLRAIPHTGPRFIR